MSFKVKDLIRRMVWDLKILSNEKELKGLETPGWPGGNYHIFWTIRCTALHPPNLGGKEGFVL